MSENEKVEAGKAQEQQTITPLEAAENVARGKLKLLVPIEDGEKKYEELTYDFMKLTGWELARAIDASGDRNGSQRALSDIQALSLFAAAAAKCTGGLDERDIKERMGAMDAVTAIGVASIFFRGSLLAGSLRITKE